MTGSDHTEEDAYHVPVLCKAVLEGLITDPAGTYVDGTVGGGGHADAILNALETAGRLFGIDQDPDALAVCRSRFSEDPRFELVEGNFRHMTRLLADRRVESVSGVLLDLGVSSHQIDTAARGFSYRADGPLDMRMNPGSGESAAQFLNNADEREIVQTLRVFGEEPRARRIARTIIDERPVRSTRALAEIVEKAVPARDTVKSLSRVFQAIRIRLNAELDALEDGLAAVVDLLVEGGRIAVISYHSLEDRRVKLFFRAGNLEGIQQKDLYGNVIAPLRPLTRRAITADEDEAKRNPRSRSARLRIAERVAEFQ